MFKKSTTFISLCLLLLWSLAQGIDAWHHMHEEHEEEVCEVDSAHYCAPHFEAELCGLCTVVHGNTLQYCACYNLNILELSVSNESEFNSSFFSSYVTTVLSRGPPA